MKAVLHYNKVFSLAWRTPFCPSLRFSLIQKN
jgi:hypothetical protein